MSELVICHVCSFTNGMTLVFDQNGDQMPDFQGRTNEVLPKIKAAGFEGDAPLLAWRHEMKAPWTPDQVAALDRYQRSGQFHPFTCQNRGDGNHRPNGIDLGGLIPTTHGWICQYCDYTQDWAHDFMVAP